MRGDRVGVGNVGAMQGGARGSSDETCSVDSWITIWEHERGMVSGRCLDQRAASGKPRGVGIGISDGAWIEPWACSLHGDYAVRAYRMRGDRVGVRDIGAMQGWSWGSEIVACVDDGRGAAKQRDRCTFDGHWGNIKSFHHQFSSFGPYSCHDVWTRHGSVSLEPCNSFRILVMRDNYMECGYHSCMQDIISF